MPFARDYRWELAFVGICLVWGSTFVMVQDAIETAPPFLFLALRFAVGAAVLAAFGAFRGLRRPDVLAGGAIGVALFGGYALQTVGLQYTSPSNSAFITSLFVVFTPLLGTLALRALPSLAAAVAVVIATVGLALLTGAEAGGFAYGEWLTLLCAVSFSVQILLTGRLAPDRSPLRLAAVEIAVAALLAGAWSAGAERTFAGLDGGVWVAVLVTGVLATAVAFWVQTRGQQVIAPTRAAVLFTAEPVFAGMFGYVFAGDRLGARGFAGAGLILVAILVAELLAPARETV